MPWVQAEASRYCHAHTPADSTPDSTADSTASIDGERSRTVVLYAKGYLRESELDACMADLDARRQRLDHQATLTALAPQRIDWEGWSPAAIGGVLRVLWVSVRLGPDFLPVDALWRVPEWRA
jgi:hypothetical protein